MVRDILQNNGVTIGRKHIATLMRRMGIEALYQRPRTSKPHQGHKLFPYLLRNLQITAPNQIWDMDITYIRMRRALFILPHS
jgi:putative transposase